MRPYRTETGSDELTWVDRHRIELAIMADDMSKVLDPFRFVLIALAGWMNHRQYQVIDYLREENRVLRE